jgi:hypothetical protein
MSEEKTETKAPATVFKYVGNGDYFVGVPLRDLTKDDLEVLTDEQKEAVTKGSLYNKKGAK